MNYNTVYVGMDVHKESFTLCSMTIEDDLNPWSWFLHRLLKSYNFKLLRYFVVHIIIHPPGEENIW